MGKGVRVRSEVGRLMEIWRVNGSQICPFDKSTVEASNLRIDRAGAKHHVVSGAKGC